MTGLQDHVASPSTAMLPLPKHQNEAFELDLRHVERGRRASAWLEWNAMLFGKRVLPVNSPEGTLDGYIRSAPLAAGQFCRIRPAFRRVLRHRITRDCASSDVFTIVLQLAGSAVVRCGGHIVRYGSGDVRFHCSEDFEEDLSRDAELLLLRLPMALVGAQQPLARALPSQRLDSTDPVTRLIRETLLGAFDAGPTLTLAQQDRLLISLIGLLGVLRIDAAPCGLDRTRWRVQEAVKCVDVHLFDPAFGARELAESLHISRRRLDELFACLLGMPVAPYIWERRLHYASGMLRDPVERHRTITDVALSHGFGDVAHFARAFKRRFGVTARQWRAAGGTAS